MSQERDLTGIRILVVDDESMLRQVLRDEFSELGASVEIAENGTTGFRIIKEKSFDILLTDIRMPGGGGFELIRNIRQIPLPELKIFVMSGFNDANPVELKNLNVELQFSKPFNTDEIIEAIFLATSTKVHKPA